MLKTWMAGYMTPGSSDLLPYSFLTLKTDKWFLWNRSLVTTARFAWNNSLYLPTCFPGIPDIQPLPQALRCYQSAFLDNVGYQKVFLLWGAIHYWVPIQPMQLSRGQLLSITSSHASGCWALAWVAWNRGCKNLYARENIIWYVFFTLK